MGSTMLRSWGLRACGSTIDGAEVVDLNGGGWILRSTVLRWWGLRVVWGVLGAMVLGQKDLGGCVCVWEGDEVGDAEVEALRSVWEVQPSMVMRL